VPGNSPLTSRRFGEIRDLTECASGPRLPPAAEPLRVSEACALCWAACKARKTGVQITVIGSRGKVRSILLPGSMWRELVALRGDAEPDDPVFKSRQGRPLDPMSMQRVEKAAAIRAGLPKAVSPHWLRHAHCARSRSRRQSGARAPHRRPCRFASDHRLIPCAAERKLVAISCLKPGRIRFRHFAPSISLVRIN
jgi:integrase